MIVKFQLHFIMAVILFGFSFVAFSAELHVVPSTGKLLIRQLNIENFQMPANKPLACCPLPREREQVSAAGKRM